uniref:Uncharacterized protein n=1 Tax=Strongyloides venezuelensis TaxID=75913 RepID=A0A0K0FSZ1_STRVS
MQNVITTLNLIVNQKKFKAKLTPITLEVKYEKDKSKDGVMPCGKMLELTVIESKGSNILVYSSKIFILFKYKEEYKAD